MLLGALQRLARFTLLGIAILSITITVARAQDGDLYLPIIFSAPGADPLLFGSVNNCTDSIGNFTPAPATFPYGIRQLFVGTIVDNAVGLSYAIEWTISGTRQPSLDATGVFTQSPQSIGTVVVYGPNSQCNDRLPRGDYQVNLVIGQRLHQIAVAIIQ